LGEKIFHILKKKGAGTKQVPNPLKKLTFYQILSKKEAIRPVPTAEYCPVFLIQQLKMA
jgi:hypothetical protein